MAVTDAIKVLVEFAADYVSQAPVETQVKVYIALAETMPSEMARMTARNLAQAQSRVAALQLEFRELLEGSGDGKPRGAR